MITNEPGAPQEDVLDTPTTETEVETVQDTETTQDGFTLDGAISEIKKLRSEAASYRVKAKEAEEAKGEIESKLKDLTSKSTAEITTLKLKAALAGKVVDVDKAIRLVDESYYDEDGTFNAEKFLADNDFLAPKTTVNNTALNKGNSKPAEIIYTPANWFDNLGK